MQYRSREWSRPLFENVSRAVDCAVTFSRVFEIRLKRSGHLIEQWPRLVSQQQSLFKQLSQKTFAFRVS